MNNELIVVVRSAGERTKEACIDIIKQQIPDENIFVVEEVPFEATLRKCYKIGIESGKKWMLTIDADVLLHKNAIRDLLERTNEMSDNVIAFEGILYDHLLLKYKRAGHKLYRCKHLEKAIQCIPENNKELRPETATLKKMTELGYKYLYIDYLSGIHDFEQYYADIYRKIFLRTRKSLHLITNQFDKWKKISNHDSDFLVVCKAVIDSFTIDVPANVDYTMYEIYVKNALNDLNLSEKNSDINIPDYSTYVDKILVRKKQLQKKFKNISALEEEGAGFFRSFTKLGKVKLYNKLCLIKFYFKYRNEYRLSFIRIIGNNYF